ncbi:hypothetical protein Hanom_Chr15g01381001 [Helianthus anomalus]
MTRWILEVGALRVIISILSDHFHELGIMIQELKKEVPETGIILMTIKLSIHCLLEADAISLDVKLKVLSHNYSSFALCSGSSSICVDWICCSFLPCRFTGNGFWAIYRCCQL